MIELLNFILYNQDLTNPNTVLVLMAVYSKAFNLRWQDNTDQMYKKAYGRLWMIRNLKKLGVLRNNLLDVI